MVTGKKLSGGCQRYLKVVDTLSSCVVNVFVAVNRPTSFECDLLFLLERSLRGQFDEVLDFDEQRLQAGHVDPVGKEVARWLWWWWWWWGSLADDSVRCASSV